MLEGLWERERDERQARERETRDEREREKRETIERDRNTRLRSCGGGRGREGEGRVLMGPVNLRLGYTRWVCTESLKLQTNSRPGAVLTEQVFRIFSLFFFSNFLFFFLLLGFPYGVFLSFSTFIFVFILSIQ